MENPKRDIAVFKAKAQTFANQFKNLREREKDVPARWKPHFSALVNRGEKVKEKIQAAGTAIDSGYRFGRGAMGLNDKQMHGLGILPLLPLAFISGTGAVMSYFAHDAATFNSKLDELERLQELGYSKEEAAAMLEKPVSKNSGGPLALLQNPYVKWGALAVAGWWGYNKFVKKKA